MTTVVFAGPTLAADDIRGVLEARVLPPVAQGDVYRVAREGPVAIGIIDGYFDGVPSVWHKEILWAMEQGITVFGSASMGALRAAELADFGMIGIGTIFEAYRNGEIVDDDEVAVLHGPAELGFVPLSEPMVSVRATVEKARADGVLTEGDAAHILSVAKSVHYRDRTWEAVLARCGNAPGMAAFSAWVATGKVDAKREDACAMLAEMASFLTAGGGDGAAQAHRVERTLVWQSLVRRIEAGDDARDAEARHVLDEVRLDPERYAALRDRAALRCLALKEGKRSGLQPDRDALQALMERHRREQNLPRREVLMRWLQDNDLDVQGYEALVTEAGVIEEVISAQAERLDEHILAELRWSGAYRALKTRADEKAEAARQSADAAASPDRLRMLVWFFEERLDRGVPDDLEAFAASIGLAGRDALFELIEREFTYCFNQPAECGAAKAD